MEFEEFKEKFVELLEETKIDELVLSTKLRELDDWSSLMVLSIIAMADEEYNVKIKGSDISNTQTLGDLFELVKSRLV